MVAFIVVAALIAEILLIVYLPLVGWGLLVLIALLLLLVLFIPIGVRLKYVDNNFSLYAKISRFELKLLPKKEKKKKAVSPASSETAKPPEASEHHKEKKKLNFSFEEIIELAKKAIRALGRFGKLTVHKFMLHYVAAGSDPYNTAMSYGYVNAALSALAPVCRKCLSVRDDVDVWTAVDFTADKTKLDAELSITLMPVQLVHVALVAVLGAIPILLRHKRRLAKERRALANENKNKPSADNTEENKTNLDTEERMDSNG